MSDSNGGVLGRTVSYDQMLNRIALGTLFTTTILTWLLTLRSPYIRNLITIPNLTYKTSGDIQISLTYIVPGIAVSVMSRIIKLHDKISDIIGIRRDFDIHEILLPLAGATGIIVDLDKRNKISINRKQLMDDCFYNYASSPDSKINNNLVKQALDTWTWYWILIETLSVLFIFFIIFLTKRIFDFASYTAITAWILYLVSFCLKRQAISNAHREVRAITTDVNRKMEIQKAMNAIPS